MSLIKSLSEILQISFELLAEHILAVKLPVQIGDLVLQ